MSKPPPPPPPPGEIDPEFAAQSKGPAIIATTCVFISLATFSTACRLYVRGGIMKKLQLDDLFITLAVVRLVPSASPSSAGSLVPLAAVC